MGEQLDLACGKAVCLKAESVEAVVRFKEELARLQKELDLRRRHMATAESSVAVWHVVLDVATVKVSDEKSESVTLRKKSETSTKTHAETKAGLA